MRRLGRTLRTMRSRWLSIVSHSASSSRPHSVESVRRSSAMAAGAREACRERDTERGVGPRFGAREGHLESLPSPALAPVSRDRGKGHRGNPLPRETGTQFPGARGQDTALALGPD